MWKSKNFSRFWFSSLYYNIFVWSGFWTLKCFLFSFPSDTNTDILWTNIQYSTSWSSSKSWSLSCSFPLHIFHQEGENILILLYLIKQSLMGIINQTTMSCKWLEGIIHRYMDCWVSLFDRLTRLSRSKLADCKNSEGILLTQEFTSGVLWMSSYCGHGQFQMWILKKIISFV